jgi:aminoglycoside phosphotransferase family enzyme
MGATSALSLQDTLRFLGDPASHAEHPPSIERRETHWSYVFLTPTQVYKMKKPVGNGSVDLRALDARAANCRAEIALNRRLAPDVYLGAVALVVRDDGTLALGGAGTVVEWLVHMRRLPAAAMMDEMIRSGTLAAAHVDALARRLGDFFAAQPAADVDVDAHIGHLRHELTVSMDVLAERRFALPASALVPLHRRLSAFLDDSAELAARVKAHRIVEGHGDLRPEHVCCVDPPLIIDCVEFNRQLRLLDPFDEVAYLGLECERLGAAWVGLRLRRAIGLHLHDDPPPRLIAFYTALRACIRARLAAAHLLEPDPRTPEKWLPRARDYLAYAEREGARIT